MYSENIEKRMINIINYFIPQDYQISYMSDIELRDKCLYIIMSNSQQAILFISMIEDEFEIEFQDMELSLDNLLSFQLISILIDNKSKKRY
jgi:hypothetical protein